MQRLIEGIRKFRAEGFGPYEGLFQKLAREGQRPHSLFITCSDSRVLAELITHSRPGDLFVVKNVGNIVPPASVAGSTNSTAAAIEYAVEVLGVEDVVVCGHSQCGAMRALMQGTGDLPRMEHLENWLSLAEPVRETVLHRYAHLRGSDEQIDAAGQENVLHAVESLKTYPCVRRRMKEDGLRLHSWFFRIAGAELFAYEPSAGEFLPLIGAV